MSLPDLQEFTHTTLLDSNVSFAVENGLWLNATQVANQYGKRMDNYWRDDTEYIDELLKSKSLNMSDLKKTNRGKYGGTYIHPDLLVGFARWCSPKFAVACDQFIQNEMAKVNTIREQALLEIFKEEKRLAVEEANKMNEYDGFISVGKYTKEIDPNVSSDHVWDALEYMGYAISVIRQTKYRRLHDSCSDLVGSTIHGTSGTPVFTEVAIKKALKSYQDFLEKPED